MDLIDEFFHLDFTSQIALLMDADLPCPIDDIDFDFPEVSVLGKESGKRIGGTTDIILIRLVKMFFLTFENQKHMALIQVKDVDHIGLKVLVLRSLIFLRISDEFPSKGISTKDLYSFAIEDEHLVVFKQSPATPDSKTLPPK